MKMYVLITAMLCFCATHNCEAKEAGQKKADGADCQSADQCVSGVCTDKKCVTAAVPNTAKKKTGEVCATDADCETGRCVRANVAQLNGYCMKS